MPGPTQIHLLLVEIEKILDGSSTENTNLSAEGLVKSTQVMDFRSNPSTKGHKAFRVQFGGGESISNSSFHLKEKAEMVVDLLWDIRKGDSGDEWISLQNLWKTVDRIRKALLTDTSNANLDGACFWSERHPEIEELSEHWLVATITFTVGFSVDLTAVA